MEISALVIRVVLLSVPGLLAGKLYWKLRGHPKRENWEKLFDVMLFSLVSYTLFCSGVAIVQALGFVEAQQGASEGYLLALLNACLDDTKPLNWFAILGSSCVGVALACLASYNHKYFWVMRAAGRLRMTSRLGDEDMWESFFNLPQVGWVVVHDGKRNLMFYGFARYFSDSEVARELVLENVQVYTNDTGEALYEAKMLYLSGSADDWLVEVEPKTTDTRGENT